jgi:hypothetical protein
MSPLEILKSELLRMSECTDGFFTDEWRAGVREQLAYIESLERDNAELRKRLDEAKQDTGRLNFLELGYYDVRWLTESNGVDDYVAVCYIMDTSEDKNHLTLGTAQEDIRPAIDRAIKWRSYWLREWAGREGE